MNSRGRRLTIRHNQIAIIMTEKYASDLLKALPPDTPMSLTASLKHRINFALSAAKKHREKEKVWQSNTEQKESATQ